MKEKEKIKKAILIWSYAITLVCLLQISIFLLSSPNVVQKSQTFNNIPTVLGETTSIRGLQSENQNRKVVEKLKNPDTSAVTAKVFLVFDLNSGQIFLEKNADLKFSIASLTKLLTAFVTYQNADLNSDMTVPDNGLTQIKPVLNLHPGDQVKVLDLFNSMLIGSCNDAALALANYVSGATGKKFVELMNQQALALGMKNSSFSNPVGFDSQLNYSTAKDIEILIRATEQLAVFKNLGRRTEYDFKGVAGFQYHATATNKLIKAHPDIEAIKTGRTESAQEAMATKINLSNHEVIILLLGSKNRDADTLELKNQTEQSFNW